MGVHGLHLAEIALLVALWAAGLRLAPKEWREAIVGAVVIVAFFMGAPS